MIAIAILFCVTMVASAPLAATGPFDFYEPQGVQQTGKGGWGYFSHNPVDYTAKYNTAGYGSPAALGRLPVSAFTGLPYAMAGYPNNGYFPTSPSPAYYPYGFQDPSYFPSDNYGSQGNYEMKSDVFDNQEELEDARQTPEGSGANRPRPNRPFINTIVNLNRLNMLRVAIQTLGMLMIR